jgi:F-type H+-transporting ATPase subunit a
MPLQLLWRLPAIKLAPDVIIPVFPDGSGITNTLLCTWISIIILVALFYFGTRRRDLIPSGIQNFLEWGIEILLGLVEGVAGKEKAKKFFPLVGTFFLFILVSNLLDVIPGVDTIGQIDVNGIHALHTSSQPVLGFLLFGDISNQVIPWIRPATSDLNLTLAMALTSVVVTQIFGFYTLGAKVHLSKYFNFKALFQFNFQGFIEFFVGILEFITELVRIISFAFRLFGNIFAGSAVLAVFAFLAPFVADVVFIPFEIFVAFIQALIFALLTLVFLQIATTSHEQVETEEEAHHEFARNEEQEAVAGHSTAH